MINYKGAGENVLAFAGNLNTSGYCVGRRVVRVRGERREGPGSVFGGVFVEITFRPPWWKSCLHRADSTTQRKLPTRIEKHTLPHTLTQHHPTPEPYHVHFQRTFNSPRPHRVHNARAPHVHRASTMVAGGTIQWMRTANSEQEARWEQDGFQSTVQTLGINDPMRVGC